jgi:F-type H+-transporting ATPase subunit epsilon
MATMQVDIVAPDREVFSGEANEVYARSQEGEIGILPGHQPVLLALDAPSEVRIKSDGGGEQGWTVSGGFLQFRDNRLTVLADGLAEDS